VRTDSLLRQTRLRVPAFSTGRIEIAPIERGGSERRFYRVRCPGEQSLILVKYNLSHKENRHYVRIAQFLARHEIHAPRIYFHDADEGLIWIEDLGETDLFSFRDEPWLVREAFYRSAIDEVAKLHALPPNQWASLRGEMPPEFNAALYRWEQNYFFENCLGRIFHFDRKQQQDLGSLAALNEIAERLSGLPRVLVHRDFQSQNIIMRQAQAYLIDFQGMRPGLAQYDLASLLFDPYARLSAGERDEICSYYLEQRGLGRKATSSFREILSLCALQRLMQALGAYGFLGLMKGHRHFLAHVPEAIKSLREIVAEMPALAPLGAALASLRSNVLGAG
jgi:aminoglycoside/choline kinase family phosphotransferase